jgi:hypothetical protein
MKITRKEILTSQRLAGRICSEEGSVQVMEVGCEGRKDRRSNPTIVPPTPEFTDDRGQSSRDDCL